MNAHQPAVERPLFQLRPITRAVVGLFLVGAPFSTHALPTGAAVSAGTAAISQSGSALTVQQTTPRLAINWHSFGIGASESVVFKQPEAGSIALNRILGQDPSVILGSLSANGQVFILNPNGVLFGAGAQVDVGGIVASTLSLSDGDFLASRYTFANTGSAGSVVNKGTIRAAEGGYVALVGPQVVNEGVIAARLGTVALGAGDQVTLQLAGSSLVGFSVDKAAVDALAANRQLIQADGGTVILSAQARDALLSTVVNNDGIVEARSVSTKNGVIRLEGGASGVVSVSGRLDASGVSAGETGGTVTITGNKVGLIDSAVVDASGNSGGGVVYIGGSRQGLGPLPNSEALFVGNDAQVRADATQAGRGGTIIGYADDTARIYGSLQARGAAGGDGGFIETSGKRFLDVARTPDITAPFGKGGEWLIDPYDITIGVGAGCASMSSATCPNGPGAQSWTSTNTGATVAAANVNAALNAGNSVTIATGAGGAEAGNITVASAIGKTAGGNATLTLTAANNIAFNAGANLGSTSNQLNVVLNAGGSITDPANVNTNGGALTFNAAGASSQSGVISGTGSVVKNGAGTLTVSGANTYTGATTVSAGVLRVQSNTALGTAAGATTVASGAVLEVDGLGLAMAEPLTLNGTGVGGGGALRNLANANTLTGAITLGAGGARINADAGTLTISGAGNITGATQPLTVGGAGNTTIGKVIATTSGTLTKDGTGTLTLSGANTYTGATLVNAGTLAVTVNNALGTNAAGTTVASGATLDLRNVAYGTTEAVTLNGGTLAASTGTSSLAGAVSLGAASTVNVTGTQLTMSGAVNNAGFGLTVDGTGNTIASGVVSGAGALTKQGPGTLTLSGNNTYTGNTSINSGTLQLGAANRIADTSAVTVASGATFNLNNFAETVGSISGAGNIALGSATLTAGGNNTSTAFSGAVSGTGGLTKAGTGTFTLSGTNTYTGTTTVSAGTLALSNGAAIADSGAVNMSAAGANLTLNGGETIGSLAGVAGTTVTLGGNTLTTGGNNTTTTYAGAIGGTGGMTKVGTGTMTLSGANTYTGATTLSAGTLALGANDVLADGSNVVVNGGALSMTTRSDTVAGVQLVSGSITGTTGVLTSTSNFDLQSGTVSAILGGGVGLNKTTAGALILSGNNTYTGTTAINAGTLQLGAANRIADTSAVTVASGATFNLNNFAETVGSISGAGNIALGSATLTAGGNNTSTTFSGGASGTGGLTKAGTGTLALSGTNTYTGTTTVSTGTLALSNGAAIADASAVNLSAAGANLTLNAGETIGSLAGVAGTTVTLGGNTLTAGGNNSTTTYAGVIGGTGGLTKVGTGTMTLSGANTFGGTTTINAGTLALSGGSAIVDAGIVNLNGGTLLVSTAETIGRLSGASGTTVTLNAGLTFGDATDTTIASTIGGAGTLVKQGMGTLTVSGANTYTGATTVSAGVLRVQSNTALGTAAGATTVASGAVLEVDGLGLAMAEPLTLNGTGVGGGGALRNLANANTLTGAITLGAGGARINADAGTLTISGAGNITGATQPLTVGGAGNTTIGKVIATTSGTLTKDGTGTLTLSGANTYTGATLVNAGTLAVTVNNALGTNAAGTTVASGATLDLRNVAYGTTEAVTLNGGTLAASTGTSSLAGAVSLGAASTVNVTGTQLTMSGAVNNAGFGLTVDGTGNTIASGVVSGAGALTKQGPGTLTLSGNNTYTGNTSINAGTLIATNANALGSIGSGTTVNSGATLELDGTLTYAEPVALNNATLTWAAGNPTLNGAVALTGSNTVNGGVGTFTLGGVIVGTGGFVKTGAGTVVVSGNNTYTGITQVSAGTLQVSSNNGLGSSAGATNVGSNARLTLNGVAVGAEPITLNGPGLFGTGAVMSNGVASLAGPITLAADSVIALNAGSTLSLGGSLNGPAGLTTGGSGTLNLNGSVGNVSPLAFFTTGAAGTTGINASLVRTSGTQSYNNPTTTGAGVTLQSTGGNLVATTPVTAASGTLSLSAAGSVNFNNAGNNFNTVNMNAGGSVALRDANAIVLGPSGVSGAFALIANGAVTQTGAITVGGASTVNAGTGPITLSGANDFGGDIALTTTGTARLNDVNNLILGASSANTFTATAGAGITLNGSITATAGGSSIVLAGASFTNNAGPFALNPGPGRWLVWSTNPASDTRGGLAYNFKQYNATFGITPVLGGGNGFLYSLVPSITPTLTGTVAKVYDGTNIATLTGANYVVTGAIDGDTVTLNNPSSGTYDNRNVATNKPVAVSGISIVSATNGAATVYGYQLASTSATGTVGTITAAPLTLTATTNTKVYDGTVSAAATPTVTGLVAGDTVNGLAQIYDNKNVGTGKTLSVSAYTVNDGNAGNNYSVTTIDNTTGVITPASLIGSITAGSKVYDGNTSATITSRTLSGAIAGDTVSYIGGTATFADRNAGVGKTVAGTGLALAGTDAGNYTVNSAATTTADITAAPLTITAATNTRTYDGTVSAAAVPNVAGLQAGDTVTGLGQVYDNRNAGIGKTLTVTSYTVNDGNGGNNYTVSTVADNTGIINPALLTITAATNTKTYDGTVSAAAIPTVAGLQAGDTATGLVQVYDNKNAGTGKTLVVSGYTVNDGNGGNNYSVSNVNNTTGVINPAALTVTADTRETKVYGDADPLPFLYTITSGGLVAGDSLMGALSRIAGENVGSYALTQNTPTAGSNYSLTFVSNPFTITPATLTYLANPATILQGTPFPVFTGTAQGFKGADTQANATTGTLAFNTTTTSSNTVGVYPINGSGLNANFGNYVFVQAPTNSTALTIEPGGTPVVPGRIPDGYVGALASVAQSESACAELQDSQQTETLCGAQQNFRQAEQVNLVPGWRRVIDLGAVSLTVEGEGLRLPDGARGQ